MIQQQEKQELASYTQLVNNLKKDAWVKVLYLIGSSKAGKTTLSYYLAGENLQQVIDTNTGVQMIDLVHPKQSKISHESQSQTVYPHIEVMKQNTMVVDTPGFIESRIQYRLVNAHIIYQTLHMIKNIHFILVISNDIVDNVDKIASEINNFMSMFNQAYRSQISNHISICLTKTQTEDDKQNLIASLQQLQEFDQQKYQFIQKILQQNKIFEFGNKKPVIEEGLQLRNKLLSLPFLDLTKIDIDTMINSDYEMYPNDKHFKKYQSKIMARLRQEVKDILKIIISGVLMSESQIACKPQIYNCQKDKIQNIAVKGFKNIKDYQPIRNEKQEAQLKSNLSYCYIKLKQFISEKNNKWCGLIKVMLEIIKKIIEFSKNLFNQLTPTCQILYAISKFIEFKENIEENQNKSQLINQLAKKFMKELFENQIMKDLDIIDKSQSSQDEIVSQSQPQDAVDTRYNTFQDYNPKYQLVQQTIDVQNQKVQSVMNMPRTYNKFIQIMDIIFSQGIQAYINKNKQNNRESYQIEDRMYLEQLSLILEKHSLYQDAIWFRLAISDYNYIEELLHQGFQLDGVFNNYFLFTLAEILEDHLQDKIALTIHNHLIAKSQTRYQAIIQHQKIVKCHKTLKQRISNFKKTQFSLIKYRYLQNIQQKIKQQVNKAHQRYQEVRNTLQPSLIKLIGNFKLGHGNYNPDILF